MKQAEAFYRSPRWKRLRAAVLRRDGYLCQWSKRFGKRVEADTVHHVFPREDFPEYEWAAWNLVALSGAVHDSMHVRGSRELTGTGKALMRIVARRAGVEVPEKYL